MASIAIIAAAQDQQQNRRKQVEQWLVNEQFASITDPADVAVVEQIEKEATSALARLRSRQKLDRLHQAVLRWRDTNRQPAR